jgi:putative alpha-1,2-mannosidase
MVNRWHWSATALLGVALPVGASKFPKRANSSDVLDYVNPLIGSQTGGNVFAGATLPYGMVKGK